jgi:hypothetical protein
VRYELGFISQNTAFFNPNFNIKLAASEKGQECKGTKGAAKTVTKIALSTEVITSVVYLFTYGAGV